MAQSLDDAEFWLPSQFLTDDFLLMDKENFNNNGTAAVGSGFGSRFPTEFPYEFESFSPNSALGSPVDGVTETESSDEEDFLFGLTRRLAQSTLHETQKLAVPSIGQHKPEMVMSGSPQSTLSGIGSWSGRSTISSNGSPNGSSQVPSPPTTPFGANNDTWDLISAAAGQVARLKMSSSGEETKFSSHGRGLLGPPRSPNPSSVRNPNSTGLYTNQSLTQNLPQLQHVRPEQDLKSQSTGGAWGRHAKAVRPAQQPQENHQQQQQIQSRVRNSSSIVGFENGRCGRPVNLAQSAAWPSSVYVQHLKQQPHHNEPPMRTVLLCGSGLKKECAGTGVFLPRRYGNPPESRKKTAGCPTVLLPAKVVQALNLSFDMVNNGHSHPRFSNGFAPDHEALVARRNALLAQQRRSLRPEGPLNHDVRLPQEWTY